MPVFTESQLLEKILESKFNTDEPINLLCCVNDSYVNPMINLMYSIRHFCSRIINLYVYTTKLSNKSVDLIKDKMANLNIEVNIDNIDIPKYKVSSSYLSIDTYLRVFAFERLSKEIKKILYLDADIMAFSDISEVYDQDVTGYTMACVHDISSLDRDFLFKTRVDLKIKHDYFNAGVLLFNLEKQRQTWNILDINKIIENNYLPYNDQDLLNIYCLEKDLKFLPYKSNFQCWWEILDYNYLEYLSPILVHFMSSVKPWKEKKFDRFMTRLFFECACMTGLSEYCSSEEKRETTTKAIISKDNYKHKLCVYAIAKNEAKFVNAWVDSMQEADDIYVLIDGTTSDDTEKLLKARGVHVTKKTISPWRFDTARNESLKLVPEDIEICVCTDLDEIFEPGWRAIVDKNWQEGICRGEYDHWVNAFDEKAPRNLVKNQKIHSREGFYWKWAIHEYIMPEGDCKTIPMPGVLLKHYPDRTKPRSYIDLLQQAIKDEPEEKRYYEFLVAEGLYYSKWNIAEEALGMLEQKFNADSSYDYCFIYRAKCEIESHRDNYEKVEKYCNKVISRYKNARWFYGELGSTYIMKMNKYEQGIELLKKCLEIKEGTLGQYEIKWQDYDNICNYISIGYYWLGKYHHAIEWIMKALKNKPDDKAFNKNLKLYREKLEKDKA